MANFRNDSARAQILAALAPGDRALRFAEIRTAIFENGGQDFADISLRQALTKLVNDGDLIRPQPGEYALACYKAPEPTNSPKQAIRTFILTTLAGHRSRAKYVVRDAHTLKREYREIHGVTLEWRIFDNELKALMAEGTLYQVEQDWLKDTYMGEKDVIEAAILRGPPAAVADIFA